MSTVENLIHKGVAQIRTELAQVEESMIARVRRFETSEDEPIEESMVFDALLSNLAVSLRRKHLFVDED